MTEFAPSEVHGRWTLDLARHSTTPALQLQTTRTHLLPPPCSLLPSGRAPCVDGSLPSSAPEMDLSSAPLPMRAPEDQLPLLRCSCSPRLPSDDTKRADRRASLPHAEATIQSRNAHWHCERSWAKMLAPRMKRGSRHSSTVTAARQSGLTHSGVQMGAQYRLCRAAADLWLLSGGRSSSSKTVETERRIQARWPPSRFSAAYALLPPCALLKPGLDCGVTRIQDSKGSIRQVQGLGNACRHGKVRICISGSLCSTWSAFKTFCNVEGTS